MYSPNLASFGFLLQTSPSNTENTSVLVVVDNLNSKSESDKSDNFIFLSILE